MSFTRDVSFSSSLNCSHILVLILGWVSFDSTERAGNATPKLTREQATHVQTLLVAFFENQIKPMMAQAKVGLIEETPFFVSAKNVKASMGVQTENVNHVRTRIEALEKRMTQDRTGFGPTPRAMSHSASTSAWLEAGVGIAPLASPAPNDVVPALSNRMDQAETNIRSLIAEGNAGAISSGVLASTRWTRLDHGILPTRPLLMPSGSSQTVSQSWNASQVLSLTHI